MRQHFVSSYAIRVALFTALAMCGAHLPADEYRSTASVDLAAIESQLWLVSTRHSAHGQERSSRRLSAQVSRYEEPTTWRPASLDELVAARDPRLTTIVLVHGNDTDEPLARSKGLGVYQALAEGADQSFRLIVWSWPSDYIRGTFRQDARVKAERADIDAYYLAQFIMELDRSESLTLVGYSFGARVITGALHLVGGGSLAERSIDADKNDGRAPIRTVLMAAALDNDWLLPGRRHGRALSVVDRMVLLVNPRDRVLRWYRFLAPGAGASALGARGVASLNNLGSQRQKIEQVNVNPLVGGQHGWSSYASSPEILEQLKREVFLGTARRQSAKAATGGAG